MKFDLKNITANPGVYLFKNTAGKIIYVGKAINLKNRINSYFQKINQTPKTKLLVTEIADLETISVQSELEALLLEAKLIKKFQPEYNSQLKDDKDYLYIILTAEEFPAVITGRKQDLVKASDYFGPFPSANAARQTLKTLRLVIPFRINCRPKSLRACLGYHLGLCPGVCAGTITAKEYRNNLRRIKKFLNGETKNLVGEMEKEVKSYAKTLNFEKAAEIQKQINAIKNITTKIESVEKYLTGPRLLENRYENQLLELKEVLRLEKLPERIECYDISNISGTEATGSMVVLEGGQTAKNDYRRFKIKKVKSSNDPAMMREVLTRRFKNSWKKPDLIIVDGGKTQLSAALEVLAKQKLKIPVFGLAKKLEEIHRPGDRQTIRFGKYSGALQLLQRIRDEAHRFAITYHRYLRSKNFLVK